MDERNQTDDGRSPLRTLVLLALTFAVGYVLGSRNGGLSDQWEEVPSEPTEITIEGENGEGQKGEGGNSEGRNSETENGEGGNGEGESVASEENENETNETEE